MGLPSRRLLLLTCAVAAGLSCGGSSPTSPVTTGPVTTGSPASTPATIPTAPTPAPSTCPYGKGTVDSTCFREAPSFLNDVDMAINQLGQQHPELFNFADTAGPGGWLVLDEDKFYGGVIGNLQATGFCAAFDFTELQVKNSNAFNDQYSILLSSRHVRRGPASYRSTCRPAAFPLDPADLIASVRVAFFGFHCPAGVTAPPNGAGLLPIGCTGFVTASPKTKDNRDVDPRVHGPEIFWNLKDGADKVVVEDYPGVAFNKNVTGIAPGDFTLCASVKGVEGCLFGKVTD